MDKQQFCKTIKTNRVSIRERERERERVNPPTKDFSGRVNNARGVFDFLIFDRKNKKVDPSSSPPEADTTGQENL